MKTSVKRLLTALAVAAAMFCFGVVAFAADGDKTMWDVIAENPLLSGAVKDILMQFVQALGETLVRYIKAIVEFVGNTGVIPS